MAYLKPQSPLQHKDGDYFYPLTTADQVVMEDGSRLNSVFKHTVKTNATLLASNWSNEAPYTQTITLDDNIDTELNVDVNIAYSGVKETDEALISASGCLTYIKKNVNNIVFYCLKKKPEIDIPIEIEGSCRNSIATIEDGVKLNFDIVGGTTEPENPTENMIWVNTNTDITGYQFSAEYRGKNLLKNTASSKTANGITFTVNTDGSVTANGTSTGRAQLYWTATLPAGEYIYSVGFNTVDAGATAFLSYAGTDSTIYIDLGSSTGEKKFTFTTTTTFTAYVEVRTANYTVNNVTFYPMIRLASETNDVYIPYGGAPEGMVWISTDTYSPASFNALKKNDIQVYPISAKQYVGGAWVDVTTKSYQGGEWVSWIPSGALYYRGNECVHITGGWRFAYEGSNASIGTGVKNNNSIKISTSGNQAISATTVKALDLSKVNTVSVNITESIKNTEENRYRAAIMLIPEGKALESTQAVTYKIIPKTITAPVELNVSGITSGRHFICVYLRYESGSHSLTFDEVMTT